MAVDTARWTGARESLLVWALSNETAPEPVRSHPDTADRAHTITNKARVTGLRDIPLVPRPGVSGLCDRAIRAANPH